MGVMEEQEVPQVEGWVPGDEPQTPAEAPAADAEPEPDPDAKGLFVILIETNLKGIEGYGDDSLAYLPLVEVHGKGQADAMRAFLADEKRLADLGVHEGDVLAAVPLRSWQPKPVRARGFVWG